MNVTILRLGHRVFRDKRLTTHVFLAARALGASDGIYSGDRDSNLEESIQKLVKNWGGDFRIRYDKDWYKLIKNWTGDIVHLTVYGLPFQDKIDKIRKNNKDILLIIGGEKVPHEVFQNVEYNLCVTSQPHSEVSGLALFLHELFQGKELDIDFKKWKLKVLPQKKGKKTIKKE